MSKIPEHVAIIMDGNGRWAVDRNLPRTKGHQQGAKVVKEIVTAAKEVGIKYLTLYAFSSENWQRPELEIKTLMRLLEEYLKKEIRNLQKQKIRIRAIGDLTKLPGNLQKLLEKTDQQTASDYEMEMILALSYGGRQEITDAVKAIVASGVDESNVTEALISKNLYTADIPDPELLIRTSNEQRLSNFLLWQLSYAEFIFVDEYWPDFSADIFNDCLAEYSKRNRRFGDIRVES